MTLPNFFMSKEQYEDWLDTIVQEQCDEFLDYFEGESIDKEMIDEWCRDAPFLAAEKGELSWLYGDVKSYSDRASTQDKHHFGPEDWFDDPLECMARFVEHWIVMDIADRMQLEVERRGHPTGPPVEEIEG